MTYTVRAATAVVLAAVLVLAVSPVGMARFSDVPPGAPYADADGGFPTGYLLAAQQLGLTEGMGLTGAKQPMLRWQMAVALVNALNAPHTTNPDGSPNPVAPGAAGSTWLADLCEREPTWSMRARWSGPRRAPGASPWPAGRTFQWNDDTEVQFNNEPRSFKVDEIITDPFRYLVEGKRVAVTYLGDDARRINLITDYFPEAREVVDVRAREGRVTVFAVVFQVSDETLILWNGEPTALARLEQVHAGFKECYGRRPVARLRVYGSSPSNPLIYLSVSTKTVSGVIDRQGSDRDGPWVEIDGRR